MGIVAVAGGSGDLGGTIVKAVVATKKHKVFILSRRPMPTRYGAEVLVVDYGSVDSIGKTLRKYKVDTVISTINLHWDGAPEAQIHLIQAAAKSEVVKRFIPSEFNIDYHAPEDKMPYRPRLEFQRAERELELNPKLTYTLIRNGFFMDYLGLPYMSTDLSCHLYCLVDLANHEMVIPGDGEQTLVITHTTDVGRLVAALLDVEAEKWPREAAIIGDRLTLNEIVQIVQEKTGRSFQVRYDSVDVLRKNTTTELPSNQKCYDSFPDGKDDLNSVICTQMIGMASGVFDISGVDLHTLVGPLPVTHLGAFLEEAVLKSNKV